MNDAPAQTEETTGVDWDAVKAGLESAEWEDDFDNPGTQVRREFLGTVFRLFPSGKYYTPWATSNLTPCRECRGVGSFPHHRRRRIAKKWRAKGDPQKFFAWGEKNRLRYPDFEKRGWYRAYRAYLHRSRRECRRCGGCGCREAYLDEQFRELLESEAEKLGLTVEHGEGDPCDVFAAEYRDAPDNGEEDEDEDEDPEERSDRE